MLKCSYCTLPHPHCPLPHSHFLQLGTPHGQTRWLFDWPEPALHFKHTFVNAEFYCHGKLWRQSSLIRFWWNSFDSAAAVLHQLAKGKSVKANALSINSISSWIGHLMESKMAPDLFAIRIQWIWKKLSPGLPSLVSAKRLLIVSQLSVRMLCTLLKSHQCFHRKGIVQESWGAQTF